MSKPKKVTRISLRGKRYRLLRSYFPNDDDWGRCDPPTKRDKAVRINNRAVGRQELYSLVHEMMHGCFWDYDEGPIEEASVDISGVLWDLGFRRVEDGRYVDEDNWEE